MPARPSAGTRHVPGEPGVWIFILGDMVIFGLLFGTFLYYRGLEPETFALAQQRLNRDLGVLNTLLLLTSSWFIAMAVQNGKAGRAAPIRPLIGGTLLCGAGFVAVKIVEYGEKLSGGLTALGNDFFMFYFVMTGIHLLHLLLGMAFLIFIRSRLSHASWDDGKFRLLETGASFWHLVDLLWIVLFPLLYLVH